MTAAHTICLGTMASGIWRSEDEGHSWANIRDGIWNDNNIYALTADPTDSRVIYAGTQEGIFRSDDRAVSFPASGRPPERLPSLGHRRRPQQP